MVGNSSRDPYQQLPDRTDVMSDVPLLVAPKPRYPSDIEKLNWRLSPVKIHSCSPVIRYCPDYCELQDPTTGRSSRGEYQPHANVETRNVYTRERSIRRAPSTWSVSLPMDLLHY
jgi:hypothetical protein